MSPRSFSGGATICFAILACSVPSLSLAGPGEEGAKGTSFASKPPVAKSCYLHSFDPAGFPWPESDCLNYEEVFKNLEYKEAGLDWPNRRLTVKTYVRGKEVESKAFLVDSRGKLKPAQ